jgi:hypothetical protein
LDTIQDIIKNLDDIIYKSKNFAFLTWGGSLYLITQHLNIVGDEQKGYLILLTATIPILFWSMDYKWRKHILQSSARMKIISLFLNSPEFKKMTTEESDQQYHHHFPLYDPVGWIFTKRAALHDPDIPKDLIDPKYLLDEEQLSFIKVIFYKDAYLFYGTLIFLSILKLDVCK